MKKTLTLIYVLALNTIVFAQTPITSLQNDTTCVIDSIQVPIPNTYDYQSFAWSLPNENTDTVSTDIWIYTAGQYSLELYDTEDTTIFNFTVELPLDNFILGIYNYDGDLYNTLIDTCLEDNLTLFTNVEGSTYTWLINGNSINTNDPMNNTLDINNEEIINQIEFNQAYQYDLEIENSCGTFQAKYPINIQVNECHCALDMPNVFTPNDDPKNDVFKPLNNHKDETEVERMCESTNFKMEIFNQWGRHMTTVESGNDYPSWDGQNKRGNEVPAGVYFYNIVYQVNVYTFPQEKKITGSFHLFR